MDRVGTRWLSRLPIYTNCTFVDLTRTSLFFHPTERVKGVTGRHQDPPLAPSRPTVRTRYREASRLPEASGVLHSALRPPQPPCNLTGTTGYNKPPYFLARSQPPACFRRTGEISDFHTCGQIAAGGLVSQIRRQQVLSRRIEPNRVFFSRTLIVLYSGGYIVYTCIPGQIYI